MHPQSLLEMQEARELLIAFRVPNLKSPEFKKLTSRAITIIRSVTEREKLSFGELLEKHQHYREQIMQSE
jgi:hypothetical protein